MRKSGINFVKDREIKSIIDPIVRNSTKSTERKERKEFFYEVIPEVTHRLYNLQLHRLKEPTDTGMHLGCSKRL